jgi:hypothetical protein
MTDDTTIDEFAEGEWDLGEILVERKQPKDSVTVYLSEASMRQSPRSPRPLRSTPCAVRT